MIQTETQKVAFDMKISTILMMVLILLFGIQGAYVAHALNKAAIAQERNAESNRRAAEATQFVADSTRRWADAMEGILNLQSSPIFNSASLASKVQTTWPEGNSETHTLQTSHFPGKSVKDWGMQHRQETDEMMSLLDK